jgi:hypothetical protein
MIQTLFKIGRHFEQTQKRIESNAEEGRASRIVIDTFQSYMGRWGCDNAFSESEDKSGSGISVHSRYRNSSSNRNGSDIERGCEYEKNQKENVDMISWNSDDDEKETVDLLVRVPKLKQVCPHSFTQVHRQLLLDAILDGKYALQVFLAIETFGLNEFLSASVPLFGDLKSRNKKNVKCIEKEVWIMDQVQHDSNEKGKKQQHRSDYGSLLTINLTQHGYLDEAIQLSLRIRQYLHYGKNKHFQEEENAEKGVNQANQLLIDHLLDRGFNDLIHLLIGTDRKLCRTVLQTVDNRFTKQIWTWIEDEVVVPALLDPFLVVQCRVQATSPPSSKIESATPKPPSYPLLMLIGMADMAINLGFSFGFQNTMKSFRSIQFIQEYCTVLSLLYQQQPPHTSMHESFNFSPFAFIPTVLPILKRNVALQRLVVWTFATRKDGIAMAEFLALALGLRAFFAQCIKR